MSRPTEQSEAAYRALLDIPFTQAGQHRAGKQQELQRVGMQKALFSSPAAAVESTRKRIDLLRKNTPTADESAEVAGLLAFAEALNASISQLSASISGSNADYRNRRSDGHRQTPRIASWCFRSGLRRCGGWSGN